MKDDPNIPVPAAPHQPVRLSPEQVHAHLAATAQGREEDLRLIERRATDSALASTAPLPGPARDAFASDPPTLLGLRLYPVTATHIACLTRLKNKFFEGLRFGMAASQVTDEKEKARLLEEAQKLDVQPEDLFEALYIFSRSPGLLRICEERSFRSCAEYLMDHFPPIAPDQLSNALASHYFESFKTAVEFQAAASSPGSKKKNLSTSEPTALAGSSTSSAP